MPTDAETIGDETSQSVQKDDSSLGHIVHEVLRDILMEIFAEGRRPQFSVNELDRRYRPELPKCVHCWFLTPLDAARSFR